MNQILSTHFSGFLGNGTDASSSAPEIYWSFCDNYRWQVEWNKCLVLYAPVDTDTIYLCLRNKKLGKL